MQFVIKNIQANDPAFKGKILKDARIIISNHKITPGETNLNNYLLDKYKVNLRAVCLYLLSKCKIYRNLDNNVIVLFQNSADDLLASLITYGNDEIKGSNILKDAFFRDIQ